MSSGEGEARLLGPREIRDLADTLGVHPTKSLGQNFVVDPNTIRRIVTLAGIEPDDVVFEVGPGLGSLTVALLTAARRVIAVEIDPVLAAALPQTMARHAPHVADRLEVVHADALRVKDLPGTPPTHLVANLPYNVAVPVLLHLLGHWPSLRRALVMVQLEVAQRLTAGPGTKVYGAPSAKLAWYGPARLAGTVPATVFWPRPRVGSGLVAWQAGPPPSRQVPREAVFAVIDAAFAQRRKTLRTALAVLVPDSEHGPGGPAQVAHALQAAGIDPGARGEQLDINAFASVAQALAQTHPH